MLIRGAPFALVLTIAAMLGAVLLTQRLAPVYQATSSLLASRAPSSFGNLDLITPSVVDARVYQRAVLDGEVVPAAFNKLNGVELDAAALEAFMRKVSVTIENQDISSVIRIDVRDSDPKQAALYANAISESLITWDRERARTLVMSSINALEQSIAEIDAQLLRALESGDQENSQSLQALAATMRAQRVRELEAAQTRSASAVVVSLLSPLVVATPPVRAIGPKVVFNGFVALLLGLLLGYGLQLIVWALDPRVRNRDRLAALLDKPVLADFSSGNQGKDVFGTTANFFRAAVMNSISTQNSVTVGIASAEDEASSRFAANQLAASLRMGGYRTLIVRLDGDDSKAFSGRRSLKSGEPSLSLEAFLHDVEMPFPIPTAPFEHSRAFVTVIETTSPNPLRAARLTLQFPGFIRRARESYDCVIVELPPVALNADALTVPPMLDGFILCVSTRTSCQAVVNAGTLLHNSHINVSGTVLVGRRGQLTRSDGTKPPRNTVQAEYRPQEPPAAEPRAFAKVRRR